MRIFVILFFFCISSNFAEQTADTEKKSLQKTSHSISVNGKELSYTATAGTITIHDDSQKPSAEIFFVSYTKDENNANERPVTFVFNGGPGSSSVWLHMGAFGPKRILSWEEGQPCAAPYKMVDNQETLLDFTDLVFIDPVGTGFSKDLSEEKKDQFYGVDEDAKSVADFIHNYLTTFNRWLSPKYLAGESYGSIRAVCIAEYLQDNYSAYLNGLLLISPVIDFNHFIKHSLSDHLSYALMLPTYAATAWYHQLLPRYLQKKSLEEVISFAQSFALNEYSLALMKGDLLTKKERDKIVLTLSELTAIPVDIIDENNLRINSWTFLMHVFPKNKETDLIPIVGAHDTRLKGYTNRYRGENPSSDRIEGPYGAITNAYIRNDLKYAKKDHYNILNMNANTSWKWDYDDNKDAHHLDLTHAIRHIIASNPDLKILVTCGYYDLVTPFSCAKYDLEHLHLPKSYKDNIQLINYEAGHMPYLHRESHQNFKEDICDFYK